MNSTENSGTTKIMDVERRYSSGATAQRPLAIVRGEGATLWDSDGKSYIDCMSGLGVANVGHAHSAVTEAVAKQSEQITVVGAAFYNDQRSNFLAELTNRTPGNLNRVFLSNSGTEAVECALKLARLVTRKTDIIALKGSYHGRTMGALGTTWNIKYRKPFQPLVPGISHVPFNDIDKLETAITDDTAAVILELIQGEGGVWVADHDYIAALRQLCTDRGILMIADEVQTGIGRTGRLFASEHYDLVPDVICLGKALAGGIPIGATVWRDELGSMPPGSHASTFGGNPVACAAGLAVLDIMDREQLPERADRIGSAMMTQLANRNLPLVREIRGMGLMIAIDLRVKVGPVLRALMERGIIAAKCGSTAPTVLRLLPPLVISEDDLAIVACEIEKVLALHQ